jgi:hypothetical protein
MPDRRRARYWLLALPSLLVRSLVFSFIITGYCLGHTAWIIDRMRNPWFLLPSAKAIAIVVGIERTPKHSCLIHKPPQQSAATLVRHQPLDVLPLVLLSQPVAQLTIRLRSFLALDVERVVTAHGGTIVIIAMTTDTSSVQSNNLDSGGGAC